MATLCVAEIGLWKINATPIDTWVSGYRRIYYIIVYILLYIVYILFPIDPPSHACSLWSNFLSLSHWPASQECVSCCEGMICNIEVPTNHTNAVFAVKQLAFGSAPCQTTRLWKAMVLTLGLCGWFLLWPGGIEDWYFGRNEIHGPVQHRCPLAAIPSQMLRRIDGSSGQNTHGRWNSSSHCCLPEWLDIRRWPPDGPCRNRTITWGPARMHVLP